MCVRMGSIMAALGGRLKGIPMFRPARKLLSFVLIAAMAFVGVAPAAGACEAKGREGGSKPCCGTCCGACCARSSEATQACCAKPRQPVVCRCSADNERPAAPAERRSSDERDNVRLAGCLMVVLFVADREPRRPLIEDAALLSSPPTSCRQAVLCRWLI